MALDRRRLASVGRYSPTPDSSLTLRMTYAAKFKDTMLACQDIATEASSPLLPLRRVIEVFPKPILLCACLPRHSSLGAGHFACGAWVLFDGGA